MIQLNTVALSLICLSQALATEALRSVELNHQPAAGAAGDPAHSLVAADSPHG